MTLLLTILAMSVPSAKETPEPETHQYNGRHKGCNTRSCDKRMDRKVRRRVRHRKWATVRPVNGYLNSIAQCESGQRWHIATGNGFYGGLQFTLSSWRAVGGAGMPHWHTPLEQKYRAVKLSRIQGWGAWPNCS